MKTPKVSILMPVYNGEKYLREAIDSILKQTFTDFELLIVNDGSKDKSKEIIESYDDKRIVLINQKNQGVARSLNNGLKITKGEYVRRFDADDKALPESLEIQVNFLDNNPDYVMVANQQAHMTENGKIAWDFRLPNKKFFKGKEKVDLDLSHFSMSTASPVVHGTACYRRKIVEEVGNYRPEFIVSEDNDLWVRLLEKNKIAVLNKCNYFMRIHNESATHFHANKINFFRKMLVDFSKDRLETGSDPLMRKEKIPEFKPEKKAEVNDESKTKKSIDDYRYFYNLVVNAKDYKLIKENMAEILKIGWTNPKTWKMLIFPIIGSKFVNLGVRIKSIFR